MTKGKYAKFPNVPEGSTIEYLDDRAVAWYPRGERVEVKLPLEPVTPLPWEVLTSVMAIAIAETYEHYVDRETYLLLRRYADAVDAMTRKEVGDVG